MQGYTHAHVNKWGYEGWNCKWRPAGTGTTHSNRREQRRHLQWENLVQKEPDNAENMEDHLQALEKATQKAKEKLQELKKKPLEKGKQDDEESYTYTSGTGSKRKHSSANKSSSSSYESTSSSTSSQDAGKPALKKADKPSLEKDGKPSLEKDGKPPAKKDDKPALDKELRRTRVAKGGQPESLLQVKEEEEPDWELVEKKNNRKRKGGDKALKEKKQPLEKGTQEQKKPLDKGSEGSTTKKKEKPLEKGSEGSTTKEKEKPLEKGSEGSSHKEKEKPLEKGSKIILKEAPPRPVVVVDWHNTLEKGDVVPDSHAKALQSLMEVADVHILSYVGSWIREQSVNWDTKALIPKSQYDELKGIHTTWQKTGITGKADWCYWLGASAIFDDDSSIINECLDNGIKTFAIMTKHCHHDDIPSRYVFRDFPEAVEGFLETLVP